MKSALQDFKLTKSDFSTFGHGLMRPECVWADEDGVWVSDNRGGVSRIGDDGAPVLLGSGIEEPNGFSRAGDGSFVVAGLSDGKLHRIAPDGTTTTLLETLGGAPVGTINYAWVDSQGRIWVSVMTRRPRWYDKLTDRAPDGYVVLIDKSGPRIVADGIDVTNEVKLDPEEKYLYAVETLARRMVRFAVKANGDLGPKETVGPADLGHGAFIDGFAFDAEGNLWLTLVMRNNLSVLTRDGALLTLYDEPSQPALDKFVADFNQGQAKVEELPGCAGAFMSLPTSFAFGGPDGRTVYVGSLAMPHLLTFRSPVAGARHPRPGKLV